MTMDNILVVVAIDLLFSLSRFQRHKLAQGKLNKEEQKRALV